VLTPGWLTGKKAKVAGKILGALFFIAYMIELGVAIFGGAHAAFWHIVPAGYVQIRTISRFGSMTEYVKPWVATIHHWAVGIMLGIGIPLIAFGIIAKIFKWRAPQP
jgi:hypothetical protein